MIFTHGRHNTHIILFLGDKECNQKVQHFFSPAVLLPVQRILKQMSKRPTSLLLCIGPRKKWVPCFDFTFSGQAGAVGLYPLFSNYSHFTFISNLFLFMLGNLFYGMLARLGEVGFHRVIKSVATLTILSTFRQQSPYH